MKRSLFLAILCFLAGGAALHAAPAASAKNAEGFDIRVKVNDYPDSMNHLLLLGRYNWSAQYITDTAVYDAKSKTYVFSGPARKEGGMYLLITADHQYVDFIFDQDQHIGIEVTYPNMYATIKFKDSPENEVYQEFAKVTSSRRLTIKEAAK